MIQATRATERALYQLIVFTSFQSTQSEEFSEAGLRKQIRVFVSEPTVHEDVACAWRDLGKAEIHSYLEDAWCFIEIPDARPPVVHQRKNVYWDAMICALDRLSCAAAQCIESDAPFIRRITISFRRTRVPGIGRTTENRE